MAAYTSHQPTVTAHRNVFVLNEAPGGRPRPPIRERSTNMQISYAKGRIVKLDGMTLRIIDNGTTDLGDDDITPTTTWLCEQVED